jgi:hypothetical protein
MKAQTITLQIALGGMDTCEAGNAVAALVSCFFKGRKVIDGEQAVFVDVLKHPRFSHVYEARFTLATQRARGGRRSSTNNKKLRWVRRRVPADRRCNRRMQ